MSNTLPWVEDDGGRKAAGFKGSTRDCVTRAIAIATGKDYREVYDMVHAAGNKTGKKSSARTGVFGDAIYLVMVEQLGWRWQWMPRDAHLTVDDMPMHESVFIADLRREHFVAVIDGEVHDTWNATSRFGNGRLERVACLWLPPTAVAP